MILYLVGSGGNEDYIQTQQIPFNPPRLFSYFLLTTNTMTYGEMKRFEDLLEYMKKQNKRGGATMGNRRVRLFLDSGAYSAWSQGVAIDIEAYIAFIKANLAFLEAYSNLDDLNSPKDTWRNQLKMEAAGLHPIPTFHFNEDEEWIKKYLSSGKYEYIALGGMVPESTTALQRWLDRIWREYLCGKDGMPKVKVHGFGMTTHELIWRYPWFSIDSASWVFAGRNGGLIVPKKTDGKYDYRKRPLTIIFSEKSSEKKKVRGKHYNSLTPNEKDYFLRFLDENHLQLGKSTIHDAPEGFVPNKALGQRWYNREETQYEHVIQDGVMTNYRMRDALNVLYYTKLGEALPEWPWKFNSGTKSLWLCEK